MLNKFNQEKVFKILPGFLLASGIILVYLQIQFDGDGIGYPGLGLIGAAIVCYGVIDLLRYFTARFASGSIQAEKPNRETFIVLLHATSLMMIGAVLMTLTLLVMAGWAEPVLAYLRQRPGMVWLYFGLLGSAFFLSALLQKRSGQPRFIRVLSQLPEFVILIFLLLISLTASLLGLVELASHSLYEQIIAAVIAQISSWLL
jgi:hypothetical protein